jgi:phosphopantothenoylcysteine decarboxylase / phosphopantothenate---cysteine ligase
MLENKTIVLGVTGGIAVYKAADLASKLTQAGAKVRVIMTKNACQFVTPLTFEAITTFPVITDMFQTNAEHRINHIALAEIADAVIVAPATANILAKIASGIADDMLTTTVLATRAPIILAPAMHTAMWKNIITQDNVSKLKSRGFYVIEPGIGRLASGGYGAGRLPDTEILLGHLQKVLGIKGDLAGQKIVVTAGGTQEPIDPVRLITNRSSGKMGYALAEAARDRGALVTLITTPTAIAKPVEIETVNVETALQMQNAVNKAVRKADVLIMAAAVADYQMAKIATQKIKKEGSKLSLELVRTPDILSEVKGNFIKIGFAAESQDLFANAKMKLAKKELDIIVANNIAESGSGFGAEDNKVTIIERSGQIEDVPVMSKRAVADRILDRVVKLIIEKPPLAKT